MRSISARGLLLFGCALFAVGCGGGLGGSCPSDTNPATFTGVLTTMVPSDASLSDSSSLTATITGFQPDVEQSSAFCDSPDRYCGPQTFPIILGDACSVTMTVGGVSYDSRTCVFVSASASLASPQSCTLDTNGGPLAVTVQSGSLQSSFSGIQLTLAGVVADGSGDSATVMFQGS